MFSAMRRPFSSFLPLLMLFLAFGSFACASDDEKINGFRERGDAYVEQEAWAEAVIEYRNILQIDPNDARAHEKLAECYMKQEMFKEAYWELSETVRLDPSNVEVRLAYAGVSMAAERYDEVLIQADAIIELDPNHGPAYLLRGQALQNLDREDEVEEALLKALELETESAPYQLIVASYYQQSGESAKAEEHLNTAISIQQSVTAYTVLARLLTEMGDRDDEAINYFKLAMEKAKDPADIDGENPLPGTYNNLAAFYFLRERDAEGIAVLEEGIATLEEGKVSLIRLLARYYRSKDNHEKADELLALAATADPTDPEPFLTVSSAKSQQGDVEGALEAAEQALAADPSHVAARLRKAELLVDIGNREGNSDKIAEGKALVDGVLAEEPQSPDGLFVRAKVQIAMGDPASGVDTLRDALDLRPNWSQAHFVLGSALMLTGKIQRARAELARAVELNPRLFEARRLLIRLHADLGEHEYAVENSEIYLLNRPLDDEIRILVAQSLVRLNRLDDAARMLDQIPEERRGVDAYFAIGRIHIARGNLDEGRKMLLMVDAERPHNSKLLGALLTVDRQQGKLSHSIKRINDAVAAVPDDSSLWQLKGSVAVMGGDLVGAEEAYLKSIELDATNLEAYKQLALLYQSKGRMNETVALYERAVAAQPNSAPTHHFLGILYEMSGRQADAMKQYEAALDLDPDMGETKNNLAYLLAEEGKDLDRALKLAQEAKAAMPDSPNAADTLGWVLYKRGVSSAAIGYLREAIQVAKPDDPGIGEIRAHLSLAYEASGDKAKAIETLEASLKHLEELKAAGKLRAEPAWAERARGDIERLKAAS